MPASWMAMALGATLLVQDPTLLLRSRAPHDSTRRAEAATVVEVDHRGTGPVTVWVHQGMRRTRLGVADGMGVTRFALPPDLARAGLPLRFGLRPLASRRTWYTMEWTVNAGDTLVVQVPAF